jgi:transketolase
VTFVSSVDGPSAAEIAVVRREAARLRLSALDQIMAAGFGHLGSCLSCAEIVAAAFAVLDLPSATRPGADVLVLSKGHAAPILYAAMHDGQGPIPYAVAGSCWPGHPNAMVTPNVVVSTGSVGMGLAVGFGIAAGNRLQSRPGKVVVLAGDGEMQAGMTWEALLSVATRPDLPVLFIVDANGYQGGMPVPTNPAVHRLLGQLSEEVHTIDGNDAAATLRTVRNFAARPRLTIVWAQTRRGAGARASERNPLPMTWRPEPSELDEIRTELLASRTS